MFLLSSVAPGFCLLAILLSLPRAPTNLVGALFSFALVFPWSRRSLTLLVVLFNEFAFRDVVFRVVCVYAPNRNPDRDSFLDDISGRVDPTVPTVLAGDFNTVFDRSVDRRGSVAANTSRESSVGLARLFRDACCVDIWRYLHPSAQGFTWSRADGLVSSRIDLVACPFVWVASASSCDILPCPFSDHCALAFSLEPPGVVPPGPGLWKLNASVLLDEEYCSTIRDFWVGWRLRKGDFPSLAKWWDASKAKIKGLTVSHCVRHSQRSSQSRTLLSRLAGHLKERLDSGMSFCLGPYQSTLTKLAQLDLEAARGAQVRSRVKWVEEGGCRLPFSVVWKRKDPWIVGYPLFAYPTIPLFRTRLIFAHLSPISILLCIPPLRRMLPLRKPCLPICRLLSLLSSRTCAKASSPLKNATWLWLVWPRGRPQVLTASLRSSIVNSGTFWGLTSSRFSTFVFILGLCPSPRGVASFPYCSRRGTGWMLVTGVQSPS